MDLDMATPMPGCVPFLDDRRKTQNRLAQRRRRQRRAAGSGRNTSLTTTPVAENCSEIPSHAEATNSHISTPDNTSTPPMSTFIDLEALGDCPGVVWDVGMTLASPGAVTAARKSPIDTVPSLQDTRKAWRDSTYELWQTLTPPPDEIPRFSNSRKEPLIHTAARQGDMATMQVLVEHGFSVNARDADGRTALHVAIETYEKNVILWLLEHGIDINAVDNHGRTALSMVVNNACPTAVRLFLVHGAKFSQQPASQQPTFHKSPNPEAVNAVY